MTDSAQHILYHETLVTLNPQTHLPSQGRQFGFAIVIILGIGGLIAAGVGLAGYFQLGPLGHLNSTYTIPIMAGGSVGGTVLLVIGFVGIMYKQSDVRVASSPFVESIKQYNNTTLQKGVSGVYVLSNETGISESIQTIEREIPTNTLKCHLGVGALHNCDIMAARRSDCGVFFDFNPENQAFILHALELTQCVDSPAAYVESLIAYMDSEPQKYNHYQGYSSPTTRLQAELTRPTSWLWQDDQTGKFQHIKKLVREGKITAITQDFCDTKAFQGLVNTIQAQGCLIDTLYLSNLYAYIDLKQFHNTFDLLSQSAPLVIHCASPTDCTCKAGCQCPKQQHIGRSWEHTDKQAGGIQLKTLL